MGPLKLSEIFGRLSGFSGASTKPILLAAFIDLHYYLQLELTLNRNSLRVNFHVLLPAASTQRNLDRRSVAEQLSRGVVRSRASTLWIALFVGAFVFKRGMIEIS